MREPHALTTVASIIIVIHVLFWLKLQDLKISKIGTTRIRAHALWLHLPFAVRRLWIVWNVLEYCLKVQFFSKKTSTEYFYFISEELNIAL